MTTPPRNINPARIATMKKKTRCMMSKDGNHQWKEIGETPGAQEKCTFCNTIINWKS
jgi:hypothetical protein